MSPGADLHGTFRAARERISHHMDAFERRGDRWKEETVTDLLLELCAPTVEFRTFTKTDEGELGADWLWWWVDGSGEAFGMLVQANGSSTTAAQSTSSTPGSDIRKAISANG